jgi:hypothetical protein
MRKTVEASAILAAMGCAYNVVNRFDVAEGAP